MAETYKVLEDSNTMTDQSMKEIGIKTRNMAEVNLSSLMESQPTMEAGRAIRSMEGELSCRKEVSQLRVTLRTESY